MQPSSSESSVQLSGRVADSRGKHRMQAELKRLEQEARFLEEELEQLEKMKKASASCQEFSDSVDNKPDPLLPETAGPVNPVWDRWFEGPREPKRCGCPIL
ncbi:PREDICTED: guanine nucleotide-binding protein subunit gamma 2 [Tarenaya hassleriana]|uniref:guanine nucleotide-binding protein subunit gamma 2 n=1 Tax=Tarenaya hassleriana TaxID=28532 RepID=UPI00053C4372|nr:PREDICTED: guanine nucleotide-binding protein subunit gamma 2 [Tarenaya hassleriana]